MSRFEWETKIHALDCCWPEFMLSLSMEVLTIALRL